MSTSKRYPEELKARAVRMVLEHRAEYPSRYAAVKAVAERLDIGIESLRLWVKRADVDAGRTPGHHDRGVGPDQGAGAGEP